MTTFRSAVVAGMPKTAFWASAPLTAAVAPSTPFLASSAPDAWPATGAERYISGASASVGRAVSFTSSSSP
ncbi:hypothetical protein BV502_04585 [Leucobacter sp. OAMLP11]|nr:hypothetical protein BV502_04585 [Leucobacter sp. OAMLP11]